MSEQWELLLSTTLYRRNCPPPIVITNYQMGILGVEELAKWEVHLQSCPHCSADSAEFQALSPVVEKEFTPDRQRSTTHQDEKRWVSALGCRWAKLKNKGELIIELIQKQIATPTISLAVRGEEKNVPNQERIVRQIALAYEETGVADVTLIVRHDEDDQEHATISVQIHAPDAWPDYSGVVVQLNANGWSAEQICDPEGIVTISRFPIAEMENLSLKIEIQATL